MDLTTRRAENQTPEVYNSHNDHHERTNNHIGNGNKARTSKSIFSIRSIMDVEDDIHHSDINNSNSGNIVFIPEWNSYSNLGREYLKYNQIF